MHFPKVLRKTYIIISSSVLLNIKSQMIIHWLYWMLHQNFESVFLMSSLQFLWETFFPKIWASIPGDTSEFPAFYSFPLSINSMLVNTLADTSVVCR